jgi:pimeloyl-ACP methyl ester carboxylesterase
MLISPASDTTSGGPSNSGIDFLLKGAPLLSQMFGPHYTLISFDPRGVNNSGPLLTCFPSSEAAQNVFGRTLGLPVDSNSSAALAEAYELAGGWGQWCSRTNKGGQAGYANTPAVAADLARFVDLRGQELGQKVEDAKLWYYGLSYGAIIGTTFASLYPSKVGRMILDAVPDMQDYYNGASSDNLDDADEAVKMFFMYCFLAGKEGCAFWANGTQAIESRFTKVLQAVKADPIVVTDPWFVDMPTLATYQTVQSFVLQAVIAPVTRFPSFAQLMAGLEAGNGSAIAKNSGFGTLATAECEGVASHREYHMEEPRLIILCNDANGRTNISSLDGFKHQVDTLVDQSFYAGESWAGATGVNCRSLDVRVPQSQQFSGTWNDSHSILKRLN